MGYARVSTHGQSVNAQRSALRKAGCTRVVSEVAGGGTDRPRLHRLLSELREGDHLVVQRLDRLGRSLPDLLRIATALRDRGVELQALAEGWDTSTAQGRMLYAVMGALAEYERELLSERTRAALAERKRAGLSVGRPLKVSPDQARAAKYLIHNGRSVTGVAREMGIHRATLYRAIGALPADEQLELDVERKTG